MKGVMKEWQKPITTRRYLHPPMSERMVTLWSEGKIILGEIEVLPGPRMPEYNTLTCCGIWPVFGDDLESLCFGETEHVTMEDGIPVHGIRNRYHALAVELEAFCDEKRLCSCYIRMHVRNDGRERCKEQIGFLLRTGLEHKLVFGAPDVYVSYDPDVEVWKQADCTWEEKGQGCRDGAYFFESCEESSFVFDKARGLWHRIVELEPGQEESFTFVLGKGEAERLDYETKRSLAVKFYQKELKRITNLSKTLGKEECELIRNLTIQMLQCFAKPVGEDFVLCRQGGLQRRIWPFEALYVLEALGELGDFADYIEPAIDTYFSRMQTDDGEVVPLGIYWAMASAMALYSFSDYAMRAGRDYFERYRDRVLLAFDCIRRTRAVTKAGEGVMEGLYPPRQSCDCELVFQSWTFTDTMNLLGIQKLLEALKHYNDPAAGEVEAECNSYKGFIMECFRRAKSLSDKKEGIRLTSFVPGMKGDETKFAFAPFTGVVTWALELGAKDVDGLAAYMKVHGKIHEGLYWRMPEHYRMADADGVVRMWYTTLDDFYWFFTFRRLGRMETCREILDSTLKYSVTTEGYMLERYHEREPYFCPWSPNASGNGRLILMLLNA